MKILLDTNVILDYALIRKPFYDLAEQIFLLIEEKQIEGYITSSIVTDLYYIMRKPRGKEWTLKFLEELTSLCSIVSIDSKIIKKALEDNYKDFEDDIQYYAAVFNNLDGIVTRNPEDFPSSCLRIVTSEELLQQLKPR